MTIEDRYGLAMSTSSSAAAEHYVEGVDLLLSQNFGPDEAFRKATEADEGFALAHGALSLMLMLQARLSDAKASVERASALAAGISRRERRHVEAISLFVNGKGPRSLALIREHLDEFPRDALMLRLASRLFLLGCSASGVANFPGELLALLEGVESDYGDDWAFLGQYSFAHHESGLFEDARRLGERSLELLPTNANASHSVAHVFFETGDATGGTDFLEDWLTTYDPRAPFHIHLSWHLALFELAMCRYDRVLDLYETDIRPSVQAKSPLSLADSASLMWRIQMYGGVAPPVPWAEVRDQAAPAARAPGPAFRDAHAALAFASAGDDASLGSMVGGLEDLASQGNALAREVTLPLVRGIGAFASGAYEEAVERIEPAFAQFARMGGSHAQREVFEDTLLEAYLRAGHFDRAESLLRTRLKRRSSARDMYWLGRAQANTGQAEAASASFTEAADGWKGADADSVEMVALNSFAAGG
jgi:tetratricopeptide (TPR) repeat protein